MSLVEHAERELKAARVADDLYGEDLPNAVIQLIKIFAEQGHSGMSAAATLSLFTKLANYEPLCPLTGEDDEWVDVSYGGNPIWQNKRCSRVFKESGRAYDINAIVFESPDGCRYTSKDSHQDITFPYTPVIKIVKVDYNHNPIESGTNEV